MAVDIYKTDGRFLSTNWRKIGVNSKMAKSVYAKKVIKSTAFR